MRCKFRRIVSLSILLGGLALGCTRPAVQQKQPPDPLLWSKRSVAGKAEDGDTHKVSRLESPGRDSTVAVLSAPAPLTPVRLQVSPVSNDRADAQLLPPEMEGFDR
jgi:hypothetical protein